MKGRINLRPARFLAVLAVLLGAAVPAMTDHKKVHRLALQVSDNEVETMNPTINVAANQSRDHRSILRP
jgi:hypothetical protein